jgi:Tol biopolymer transport system component/DNA-binding winged helix-turn-helix (wHTH) protein
MSLITNQIYEFGPFCLNVAERLLLRAGENVPLMPKSFDLLLALVERHGRLLDKDELLKLVWPDTFVEEANLASNISLLRKALGEGENGRRYIETVPKHGYRFVVDVTEVKDDEQAVPEPPPTHTPAEPEAIAADKQASITTQAPAQASWINHRRRGVLLVSLALAVVITVASFYVLISPVQPKVVRSTAVTKDGLMKTGEYSGGKWNTSVVTDGARLYFAELGDRWSLKQVAATGGEAIELPETFGGRLVMDLSPNRTELLVSGRGESAFEAELWVMPVLGGSPRRLGEIEGHAATWSPDGQQIIYAKGPDLYQAKSDGTQTRKIATVAGRPEWLRWSPDGTRVRFTVRDDKTNMPSLWEMTPDGANLHPLLPDWNNPAAECCGNWTADGRYYVFQSSRNWTTSLWAIRERGSFFQPASLEPVQLTFGPMNFYAPVPSPDGKKLFAVGEELRGELVRYDAQTQQWGRYLQGVSANYLDFSRDGNWVTYTTYPEGELWRSRVDGSARRQLSFAPMRSGLPRWSPDGKQIAFSAQMPGSPLRIYLVSADGGSAQSLTKDVRLENDPGWSPDGKTLIFGAGTALSGYAIYLLDLSTHQISKLPGSDGMFSPRWSPDGRYIVGLTVGIYKMMLYDSISQTWTELATGAGAPRWSLDGNYVYYLATKDGQSMFRVSINDRKIEPLVSMKNLRRAVGVFGRWAGWAPDDSPLTLLDTGIQDIYALEWQAQ